VTGAAKLEGRPKQSGNDLANGWRIAEEDGLSGKRSQRPDWQRIVGDFQVRRSRAAFATTRRTVARTTRTHENQLCVIEITMPEPPRARI